MAKYEYEVGSAPWVRKNFGEIRCPFCGAQNVLLSYGDVKEDDRRVELYCDNTWCEVRQFTILAMRTNNPFDRADVYALHEIDAGMEHERLPDGVNIMDPVVARKLEVHSDGILGRRRRATRITIKAGK